MDIFPGAKLMQVAEWGYYMGSLRPAPRPDQAFSVVHITANLATAENEAAWRINDPALQNSATFFNNRDGSTVQLLGDPATMDPWANGDVANPDMTNPRIASFVRAGVNANERTLLAIENVGNEIAWGKVPGGHPITPAQEWTTARQIAHYHTRNGVPINRETVIGHYQLNSVNRPNCPSRDKSIIDRIVASARLLAGQEDGMTFLKGADPISNRRAVIGDGATVRSVPAFDRTDYDAHKLFSIAGSSTAPILAWVTGTNITLADGAVYDARSRWAAIQSKSYGVAFVHERDVVRLEPIEASGYTAEELEAAKATASRAGFVDAKTKAVVAVQGIKP